MLGLGVAYVIYSVLRRRAQHRREGSRPVTAKGTTSPAPVPICVRAFSAPASALVAVAAPEEAAQLSCNVSPIRDAPSQVSVSPALMTSPQLNSKRHVNPPMRLCFLLQYMLVK